MNTIGGCNFFFANAEDVTETHSSVRLGSGHLSISSGHRITLVCSRFVCGMWMLEEKTTMIITDDQGSRVCLMNTGESPFVAN